MKYLKAVLFVVVISGYVSLISSEPRPFDSWTFKELKKKCESHNTDYEDISSKSRKLLNEIFQHKTQNCSDMDKINLIEKLIAVIMPCFPAEEQPKKNGEEYNTIVKRISDKLCINHELAQFKSENSFCLEKGSSTQQCLEVNLKSAITPEFADQRSDELFYTLAMTHSKEECNFLNSLMQCMAKGISDNCSPEITKTGNNLFKKYESSLKCVE